MVPDMNILRALFAALIITILAPSMAFSQCNGQFAAGSLCANSGVTEAPPHGVTVSAYLDSVFGISPGTIIYRGPSGWTSLPGNTSGTKALTEDSSGVPSWSTPSSGTVSSVGLSLPNIFTVTGSPVTSTGTLTGSLASQSQNLVFASPDGSSGAPTFRTLVPGDLPGGGGLSVGSTTISGSCTNGYNLYNNSGVLGCQTNVISLSVGSTTISGSCTNGDNLYNNSGVLGCQTNVISGSLVAGYIPIATSPSAAVWGNIITHGIGTVGLGIVGTADTSWTPFGVIGLYSVVEGNSNGIVGYALNNLTPSTVALPIGTIGYGKITTNGNAVFGVYGLGEQATAGGGSAVAAEFTCRNNSGNPPTTNLPPDESIGTTQTICDALHVTAGGGNNSTIGIYISSEGGSPQIFNTGVYLGETSFAQYGLFISSQTTGGTPNVTSAVIQNNGSGINLQLQTTGSITPLNSVIAVLDSGNQGRFKVAQNGSVTMFPSGSPGAGGREAEGYLLYNGEVGIYAGTGNPSLNADKGSLYLETGSGQLWLNTGGGTTWTQITVP